MSVDVLEIETNHLWVALNQKGKRLDNLFIDNLLQIVVQFINKGLIMGTECLFRFLVGLVKN